jgi:hypothetical protein
MDTWGNIVGCGVHLDDVDVLAFHLLSELVVDRSKLLAVAAPGSVELNLTLLYKTLFLRQWWRDEVKCH